MRTLVIGFALAAALATAGVANAGCMATVGLTPLPDRVAAGSTWTADITVLQHGRTPMADATPAVILTNPATGKHKTVPAELVDGAAGLYRANVVFPSAGTWTVAVNDGFPYADCAQTHGFGSYTIPAPPSPQPPADTNGSFPLLPITLIALALALAAGLTVRRTRHARAHTAPKTSAQ